MKYSKRKEEASRIAQEIKDKAIAEATEVKEDSFKKAKIESEDIISKAQKTVNKIKEDIRKELESKMIDMYASLLKIIFSDFARSHLNKALIEEFIEELRQSDLGSIEVDSKVVDILSVDTLTDEARSEIKKILTSNLKKEFTLSEKVDPSLLAGIMMKFGSLTLDGSLVSKIRDATLLQKERIEERV